MGSLFRAIGSQRLIFHLTKSHSVLIIWWLLAMPLFLSAQEENNIHSIQQEYELALEYVETNPDRAIQLIEKAYTDAREYGDQEVLFKVLFTKGRIYENRQQLDSSLVWYETAKDLAELNNNKVDIASCLIQMGYVYHEKNKSQKGLDLLKEARALAEEAGDQEMEAKAANGIGRVYSFLSEFDSSNVFLNQALGINKSMGDKRGMAEIYTNIANNYGRASQREKAVEHFLLSQELMRELNDLPGITHTFRNIGVTYFFEGNYPEALQNLHAALQVVEGTEYHADIIQNLDFLGEVYMTIEDFTNAQLYWKKAEEAYQLAYGEKINPEFLFKQGRALLLKKDYAGAVDVFLEAERLKKEIGQHIGGDLYWNLGQAYEMLSKYESAEQSYSKSIELSQSTNNYLMKLKSLYGLGKIAESRGNDVQARTYYKESYDLAIIADIKEYEMEAAAGLYRMYKKLNDASQALRFMEISTNIKDSLFNVENTREIAKLEAGFAFEKEKQELEFARKRELAQEANVRRMLWIALSVAGLVLAIGIFYFRSKQKANAELSRLNEEILTQKAVVEKQKEKLEVLDEAKSRFFTNISHEFRTPLTIIYGMIGQINEKPDLWLERGTKMIKQNTAGLLNLVNQLLDLRKLESNELKVDMVNGDVVQYLRYISESHQSYAEQKGLQLHFLVTEEEIKMDYDPDKLLRIISNLLSNAIKFTPDGGNIYCQIDKKNLDGRPALRIRVQDTGVGIPEKDLPHIFGRFYQADVASPRRGEGTGIGLALARELVKILGGNIRVESTVGKGSAFTIELPIANASLIPAEGANGSLEKMNRVEKAIIEPALANPDLMDSTTGFGTAGKPSLLIVEDNPDVRQYLIACLEDDYQLTLAENGRIGIEMAIEQVPDLIVSDVMMPEKDGYELTTTLKNDERTDHIPIVLLTAKADFDSRMSGLEKGADVYLAKPFEKRELLVRLEKLLELRRKLQARYAGWVKVAEDAGEPAAPEHPFLQKFHGLIEEEMSNAELDMEKLCRSLGMSRSQLFRKAKALTDKSPTVLIRSIRLQKGRELLATSELTISEIAYEVGFTSLNYFSAAFFEEFGVRPSSFRK